MVRVQDQCYAIPQKDLEELVCLHPQQGQPRIESTLDQEVVRLRGRLLPLVRLSEVLERPEPFDTETREAIVRTHRPEAATFFAVVQVGERRFGLIVDEILKNEEIVVKPMHGWLKPLSCFSGATILGDGQVALILNVEGIVRHAGIRFGEREPQETADDGAQRGEAAAVLLFRYGPDEQFAVPLAMIRRLVMVDPQRIERIGSREFLLVDGETTPLLRLDQVLPVSAAAPVHPLFLLLPKNTRFADPGRPAHATGFHAFVSGKPCEAVAESGGRSAGRSDDPIRNDVHRTWRQASGGTSGPRPAGHRHERAASQKRVPSVGRRAVPFGCRCVAQRSGRDRVDRDGPRWHSGVGDGEACRGVRSGPGPGVERRLGYARQRGRGGRSRPSGAVGGNR
jgi:chemotaxis signal transduction protein